ncbi:hypothetical protein BGZ73_002756 [Actinomortierella ambigua]|nr:hypothetical protein BGZ73_002756 [Actinomortierella ambigua]
MSAPSRATQYTVLNASLERLQKNLHKLEDNVEVTVIQTEWAKRLLFIHSSIMQQSSPHRRVQVDDLESDHYQTVLARHDRSPSQWLTPTVQLGPLLPSDKAELMRYMNDPRVCSYLNGPPNPYKPEDADWWIHRRGTRMLEDGTLLHYVFRDMDNEGRLIGAIDINSVDDDDMDGDNIGYWLAPEYHGQSLMARAAKILVQDVSINKLGKRKFNGFVFEGNWASRRTLEKVGLSHCPEMGKTIIKDGVTVQCWRMRMFLSDEDVVKREKLEWASPAPHLVHLASTLPASTE